MESKTYSVFGAGAAGLYTSWRLAGGASKELANPQILQPGDTLELYDWGHYFFDDQYRGTRAPGARVCTWHYKDDPNASYVEVGGMRYSYWNGNNAGDTPGHRLVTTVVKEMGLDGDSVPFNVTGNQLFYLRGRNMYLNGITSSNPAPYDVNNYGETTSPDNGFSVIQNLAPSTTSLTFTREQWCKFYKDGRIEVNLPDTSVFEKGDRMTDIGYWNLMFDQLGSEGYQYTADGNGYTSNVINWNSGDALEANNEFTPGSEYRTLTKGYSSMFQALFETTTKLCRDRKINFQYHYNTRLHSILHMPGGKVRYWTATREHPDHRSEDAHTTDAAWLAMPRHSLNLVAQATRYQPHEGVDVLNHEKVQLYMEAAIMQPSYKVGMFFDQEWWVPGANPAPAYPAMIIGFEITPAVLANLKAAKFPAAYISAIEKSNPSIVQVQYSSAQDIVNAVEGCIQKRLTIPEENGLLEASKRNTIGPSITDTPIRMAVYFGNNALDAKRTPVYGMLASYDDEQYATFWRELEIEPNQQRKTPSSRDYQTLEGPRRVPERMVKMLRSQLAAMHFGPGTPYTAVPAPLEARYMDWSLPPFNAGYHVWAAHFDIGDVQRGIRKPSQLMHDGSDANIFIVGETYSNDQAWVEGAYCTSESVLNDFFGVAPIIDNTAYPFICNC